MRNLNIYKSLYTLSGNERVLLDLIWRRKSIARKDLAKETGLTGASATRLTKKIIELDLVEESIEKDGKPGSPNRPLRKKNRRYYSIGLNFNKSLITMVLVCVEGRIVERQSVETKRIDIDSFSNALKQFISESKILAKESTTLLGIGVAVPGYRSICEQQWAIHWDFDALLDTSIEDELYRRLKVPVVAERDSVAALWAERLQGVGRDNDDLFLMYLAQGVGGCAMLNGRPITGYRGNAGGVGILFPYDKPRPSFKDYRDFIENQKFGRGSDFNLDDGSNAWVEQVLPSLRHSIDTISRLYDPSHLILSGELPKSVIDKLISKLDYCEIKTGYTAKIGVPEVVSSSFDDSIALIGASVLPISALITGSFNHRLL